MIAKITALLKGLSLADVEAAAPACRQRFAALCHHWWQLAERRREPQSRAGVLSKLKDGERSE